jgi:rubrerythrin
MPTNEPFDGEPVIGFDNEPDRRNFLKWAGIIGAGGTLLAVGASLPGGIGRSALAQTSPGADIEILNYALTLEYLEADFYQRGLDAKILSGRELELVTPIASHEASHVATITAAVKELGGNPVAKPAFKYPDGTFARDKFLTTAKTFEELGVNAYHGQVTRVSNPKILAAAASIAGVESRHAAILEDLTGGQPFPGPVEAAKTMDEVLATAKPFLGS